MPDDWGKVPDPIPFPSTLPLHPRSSCPCRRRSHRCQRQWHLDTATGVRKTHGSTCVFWSSFHRFFVKILYTSIYPQDPGMFKERGYAYNAVPGDGIETISWGRTVNKNMGYIQWNCMNCINIKLDLRVGTCYNTSSHPLLTFGVSAILRCVCLARYLF